MFVKRIAYLLQVNLTNLKYYYTKGLVDHFLSWLVGSITYLLQVNLTNLKYYDIKGVVDHFF